MSQGFETTLGGERLGSGKKNKVYIPGHGRSTFDLSHAIRTTASAGTLIPFFCRPSLPGDTWDINTVVDVLTHPTIGPLFGSYKIQVDYFEAEMRLYQRMLHNNKLGIGREMEKALLPYITLYAMNAIEPDINGNIDNAQVDPSTLLAYLGIRGIGNPNREGSSTPRTFNGLPILSYYDIIKNYYWPKSEDLGAVVGYQQTTIPNIVSSIVFGTQEIPQDPDTGNIEIFNGGYLRLNLRSNNEQDLTKIMLNIVGGGSIPITDFGPAELITNQGPWFYQVHVTNLGEPAENIESWTGSVTPVEGIGVVTFPLGNIDTMRENILSQDNYIAFDINAQNLQPFKTVLDVNLLERTNNYKVSQCGLGIKCYQSDLFNNWLDTDTIEGNNGINEITAVNIEDNKFTIDALIFSRKVYDYLNKINVAGGTYDDWLDVTYTSDRRTRVETPIYHGGLSQELVFQEVISNAATSSEPLGTLAGRGVTNGNSKKGGKVIIKTTEPSYIMGIFSLTPRLDYSQGNAWDTSIKSMNDWHKADLDAIGFQDLIAEQMAWWTTIDNAADPVTPEWVQKSIGKIPAWTNYMTEVNRTYGNFAIENNEMFMTLNRRYEPNEFYDNILDATSLIDPTKFNNIFAVETIDAMNFWVQIGLEIEKRSYMSSKVMPTL